MIALGIDPGFANLGLGVLDVGGSSTRVLHYETFHTSTADGEDETRLDLIADRILDAIDDYEPALISYENQAGVEVGMQRAGVGTTFASRRVHEVSGIIRCAARLFELPCYCLAPSTVKVALLGKGSGHAQKAALIRGVKVFFGVTCGEHSADALAVAVGGVQAHRRASVTRRAALALIR